MWLGDDAAVLAGGVLFATDLMAEGVHFDLTWSEPEAVGWKALAVNCSDLAAMGGTPTAAVAAVLLPPERPGLADAIGRGLARAAATFACPLVGGDTAAGATVVVTVAVIGAAPAGGVVRRDGARPGDTIFVTGPLGGPRAALAARRRGLPADPAGQARLDRPVPRLAEGAAAAAGGASAMIDLSDGLSSDLGHVCRASAVGAEIDGDLVPVGPGATLDDALAGGDDYELCMTAADPARLLRAFESAGLEPLVAIGRVREAPGMRLGVGDGVWRTLVPTGHEHTIA